MYREKERTIATKALGNVLSTNIGKHLFGMYRSWSGYEVGDRSDYENSRKKHPTREQENLASKHGFSEGILEGYRDVLIDMVIDAALSEHGKQLTRRDAIRAINDELREYNEAYDAQYWRNHVYYHSLYDSDRYAEF